MAEGSVPLHQLKQATTQNPYKQRDCRNTNPKQIV